VARDARNLAALLRDGWRVATVWECALREAGAGKIAEQVAYWLTCGDDQLELPPQPESRTDFRCGSRAGTRSDCHENSPEKIS
jgi:DNA mismatch endonuclease (patch repair protein)